MDKITVEIKEGFALASIMNDNILNDIAEYFIDSVIIPYIEDEYGCDRIIAEVLTDKVTNTSFDDINIGMAKAILKAYEENKNKG